MQLPEAEELVGKAKGKTIVLLNAQWTDTKSVPSRHGSFVGSFETVYCFQPIAIQVCSPFEVPRQCWTHSPALLRDTRGLPCLEDVVPADARSCSSLSRHGISTIILWLAPLWQGFSYGHEQ